MELNFCKTQSGQSDSENRIPAIILAIDGLFLKAASIEDSEFFFEVITANQKYFLKFDFISPNFKSSSEIIEVIKKLNIIHKNEEGVSYGIWQSTNLLGLVTINKIDWTLGTADIGYWLIESATQKGLAQIALCSLIDICWKRLNLKLITAHTATTNLKSQKLLNRMGFNKIETIKKSIKVRDIEIDEFLYQLNRPL